jgi:hypothetical protein
MSAESPKNWLMALATLTACSHGPVHRPGDEWLEAIKFEGNHKLDDGDLVTGLTLHRSQKRGRPPDAYAVQVDADRIRGEYMRRGFLDAARNRSPLFEHDIPRRRSRYEERRTEYDAFGAENWALCRSVSQWATARVALKGAVLDIRQRRAANRPHNRY